MNHRLLLLATILVCSASCKKKADPPLRLKVGPPRLHVDLGVPVTAGLLGPNNLLAAGTSKGVVLLATVGSTAVHTMGGKPGHDGPIRALAFSPGGDRLLSAGGHTVVYWDARSRAEIRRVQGPQGLTSAVLDAVNNRAYFATDQGHVMRWRLDQQGADGIKAFSCGATRVYPARMQLPKERRCPYGTYLEPTPDTPVCAYPVTHLLLMGRKLVRACREGTLGILDLETHKTSWAMAGHLGAIAAVSPDLLVLAEAKGAIHLYHPAHRKELSLLTPGGHPRAAASSGELIALAFKGHVRLWHRDHAAALASLPVNKPVVWLGLQRWPPRLDLLLGSGKLIRRNVTISPSK